MGTIILTTMPKTLSSYEICSKPRMLTKSERDLKKRIIMHMNQNGFRINPHLQLPQKDRRTYKRVQQRAKLIQISNHKKFLANFLCHARDLCSDGHEIVPEDIELELKVVTPESFESRLFFWWNLVWWSMPYQTAYGRQIRLLIWDKVHDLPFGLVQLQSPLLRMGARDDYLNIPKKSCDYWANMSMNAQRIGALPPYNALIGGKMAALTVTSNEVRDTYRKKYQRRETWMEKRILEPNLLFVTTTSAFGKSSMYDRLRYKDRLAAIMIGQTKGMGTFHVPDSITKDIYLMLQKMNIDTRTGYGHGPSKKIRLLKQAFRHLGLKEFYAHGIRRDVYLFPLAKNLENVIHKKKRPLWFNRPFREIADYWKARWAIPRSKRTSGWKEFDSKKFFNQVRIMLST